MNSNVFAADPKGDVVLFMPMSRKFVIADPSLCIGCRSCMAACLHRHDVPDGVAVPRLQLVTTLRVSAPVGCHHCVEAPCVEACPTGCLYSDEQHVGVHAEKCIGCRNCVLACPYGAVDVVTKPVLEQNDSPEETPDDATLQSQSARARVQGKKRKQRSRSTVVKCDLCIDHPEGSACVASCPTGALRVIDQQGLEHSIQGKRKAAAHAAAAYASIKLNITLDEGVQK